MLWTLRLPVLWREPPPVSDRRFAVIASQRKARNARTLLVLDLLLLFTLTPFELLKFTLTALSVEYSELDQ